MIRYIVTVKVTIDHEEGHLLEPEERVVQAIEDSDLGAVDVVIRDVDLADA